MFLSVAAGTVLRPRNEDEDCMWSCIAVDPGGTTGWCILCVHEIAMASAEYRILDNIGMWSAGEYFGELTSQVDKLVELCMAWDTAEVVFEDFILRMLSSERSLLDPVRVYEPVKWWLCSGYKLLDDPDLIPREIALQQPSLAMTSVTDDRLKAIDMYDPTIGKPHARDALRHALTYARRRKTEMEAIERGIRAES